MAQQTEASAGHCCLRKRGCTARAPYRVSPRDGLQRTRGKRAAWLALVAPKRTVKGNKEHSLCPPVTLRAECCFGLAC